MRTILLGIGLSILMAMGCSSGDKTLERADESAKKKDSEDNPRIVLGEEPETSSDSVKKEEPEEEQEPGIKKPGTGTLVEGEWHLTFKHLDSPPLPEEGMNFGLAKALNSVSKVGEVVQLEPLEGGLSYSVDPGDFGLDDRTRGVIESCPQLKSTTIDGREWIEADSFMYCILEPRIYYQLQGIARAGNIELATERLYLKTERSAENRALTCVENSDVANGNDRMMERVERADGTVYYGTADYLRPNNIAETIRTGVYPEAQRNVGDLRAGEFMWDMDNGFIGYALSGFGAQARYEANQQVARDQSRDDDFVIAGYGCMNCHDQGYNNGNYIPCGTGDQAQYPDAAAAAALVAKDNERFFAAMQKLGYEDEVLLGDEPITAIIRAFEARTGTQFAPGGATGALR